MAEVSHWHSSGDEMSPGGAAVSLWQIASACLHTSEAELRKVVHSPCHSLTLLGLKKIGEGLYLENSFLILANMKFIRKYCAGLHPP